MERNRAARKVVEGSGKCVSRQNLLYGIAEWHAAYYLNPNDATQTVSSPGFASAMPVQIIRRSTYRIGFMVFA
jgi:hypothetical protein